MNHTHKITSMGQTILVRQIRPGIGVDDSGKEWPLSIGMGQRDYRIKCLGKAGKAKRAARKRAKDRRDTAERETEYAAEVMRLKHEPNFGKGE